MPRHEVANAGQPRSAIPGTLFCEQSVDEFVGQVGCGWLGASLRENTEYGGRVVPKQDEREAVLVEYCWSAGDGVAAALDGVAFIDAVELGCWLAARGVPATVVVQPVRMTVASVRPHTARRWMAVMVSPVGVCCVGRRRR